MVSMFSPRTLGLGAFVGVFTLGCLGPNPWLDAGSNDGETTESGDGDGDGDGDGEGDGDGDGDGDGESEGEGSCSNVILDPGETAPDCGGPCPPCADGLACVDADDCTSSVCTDDICQAPSCDDEVHNGDELEVDCGGPCEFCEHSMFHMELDEFESSSATVPQVSMFSDLSFAVTYNGPMQARARWFDEFGEPTGPDTELWSTVTHEYATPLRVAAGDARDHTIHVIEPGIDGVSINTDLFLIKRTPVSQIKKFSIDDSDSLVVHGDLIVEGSRAVITWMRDDVIYMSRFDYEISDGAWVDIQPFEPDTEADSYDGADPVLSRNADGMIAVAWRRCDVVNGVPCSLVVRRYDNGWIDSEPVTVTPELGYYVYPQVAIADDGRIAMVWCQIADGKTEFWARMLDADLELDGAPWALQTQLPQLGYADVAALSDGSFVFGWGDPTQMRVHLRRYVGPDMPKLPELGDEAPASWPATLSPTSVSISSVDNHVVIVWSAIVNMFGQVQGQVLSF